MLLIYICLFVLICEINKCPCRKWSKVSIHRDAIFFIFQKCISNVVCPLTQLALMCPLPVAKLLLPPCAKPLALSLSPFLLLCLSLTLAPSHLPSHSAIVWLCKRLTDIECRTPCDKGEGGRILRERKKGRERACSPSPLFSLLTLPSERHGFVCFWKSNIRDGYNVQKWASEPRIWKKLLKSDASAWLGRHTQLLLTCTLCSMLPPLIPFCGISAATFLLGFVLQVEARLLIGNCCPSFEHSDALRAVRRSLGWQVTAGASTSVADASPLSPVSSPHFSPSGSWPLTSPVPLWDQMRSEARSDLAPKMFAIIPPQWTMLCEGASRTLRFHTYSCRRKQCWRAKFKSSKGHDCIVPGDHW